MKRRDFLKRSALIGGFGVAGVCGYTWRWEPHWVEFVKMRLPIENLPAALVGKRLVQLTDLHIGPQVSDSFLIETFKEVQSLAPEFVVYTGDLTSYEVDTYTRAKKIFAHLPPGRSGTFGVLGNHDYGPNWSHPEVAARLSSMAGDVGVNLLRNSVAEAQGLQFVGLDDLWAERFEPEKAFSGIARNKAAIVLSHNPDTADLAGWGEYSGWILSGHTHGGQCKAPFLPPPLLPVRNRSYTSGEFSVGGGRKMYISRGVGHLLQVRFNVRPEVTVFTLERAEAAAAKA
ncbi:MAG: metallophosphoesterase [Limisphaerales bacterium]